MVVVEVLESVDVLFFRKSYYNLFVPINYNLFVPINYNLFVHKDFFYLLYLVSN